FQEAASVVSLVLEKVPKLAVHSSSPSTIEIERDHDNDCGTSSTSKTATALSTRKTSSSSSLTTPSSRQLPCFTPKSFFVSWNGVLVLLFQGFPLSLEQLKDSLNEECTNRVSGYKAENFGSKWAKVTLAALREKNPSNGNDSDNSGCGAGSFLEPLNLEKFQSLKSLCRQCSLPFSVSNNGARGDGQDDAIESSSLEIPIKSISVVEYEWRSLEKVTRMAHFPITLSSNGNNKLQAMVSTQQRQNSDSVLSEWDDEETYLGNVNAKGAPYRPSRPIGDDVDDNDPNPVGVTCVTFLDLKSCPLLWDCIEQLKIEIEKKFPGRYIWFDEESLHCTIRAMDR
ncbi:hypothetical protein ACHAXS_006720, partial [Conticribra weissflogii]